MNIESHLKRVKKFIEQINAPANFSIAILINSLDEDSQLELFSRPEYDETEEGMEEVENLLRITFSEPKTEISNLVVLLGEKQGADENVTSFLSRLRIKAYKVMEFQNKGEKEDCILSAFINGLKDKRIAKAVELIKPTDSESALFVAKREEIKQQGKQSDNCFSLSKEEDQATSTNMLIKEMSQQVVLLRQQVSYLNNLIKRRPPQQQSPNKERNFAQFPKGERTYADVARGGPSTKPRLRPVHTENRERTNAMGRGYMQCWNCNRTGHSWRNCPKRIVCGRCLSTGHVSRFCRQGEAIRYLAIEEEDEENHQSDEVLSVISEETNGSNDCLTILDEED